MSRIVLSERQMIEAVAGVVYEMHPYHNPENFDIIINKISKWFQENSTSGMKKFHTIEFENEDSFGDWIKDFLFSIKEFTDLNISKYRKLNGVTDYNNQKIEKVIYPGDPEDKEREHDFIDIWACQRNIYAHILNSQMYSEDCFLCKYAKSYRSMDPSDCEQCENCMINPKMKFNREPHPMSIKPKNQWTEEEKEKYAL